MQKGDTKNAIHTEASSSVMAEASSSMAEASSSMAEASSLEMAEASSSEAAEASSLVAAEASSSAVAEASSLVVAEASSSVAAEASSSVVAEASNSVVAVIAQMLTAPIPHIVWASPSVNLIAQTALPTVWSSPSNILSTLTVLSTEKDNNGSTSPISPPASGSTVIPSALMLSSSAHKKLAKWAPRHIINTEAWLLHIENGHCQTPGRSTMPTSGQRESKLEGRVGHPWRSSI